MTKKSPPPRMPAEAQPVSVPEPVEDRVEETPAEAVASICSVLVVGLFILTFLGQNFVIPSGSMEKTLLVGDHLVVDRITLAPPSKWMPLVHYREPKRGDVVVFIKPVPDLDADGKPDYLFLVKRLVGVPGDHIRLRNGIVILNGVARIRPRKRRFLPPATRNSSMNFHPFRPTLNVEQPKPGAWTFPTTLKMGN